MTIVTTLLDKVMTALDVESEFIPAFRSKPAYTFQAIALDKFENLWAQILEVFGGMLLAES